MILMVNQIYASGSHLRTLQTLFINTNFLINRRALSFRNDSFLVCRQIIIKLIKLVQPLVLNSPALASSPGPSVCQKEPTFKAVVK